VLHLQGRILLPAAAKAGALPIPIGTVPPELTTSKAGVVEVLAASNRFLLARSRNGPGSTVYVEDRAAKSWRVLRKESKGIEYRIFGSIVVASEENCDKNEDGHTGCVGSAISVEDLANGKVYPLPHSGDSEVIDVEEEDGTAVFREGEALYIFQLGTELDRTRGLVARGPSITNIHWAFFR